MHKFLKEIKYKSYWRDYSHTGILNLGRRLIKRFRYGFDAAETWDMDTTFAVWAYEHLRALQEESKNYIDWEYQKVTIPSFDGETEITVTEKEAIDLMIEHFKTFLLVSESEEAAENWHIEEENYKNLCYASKIWAIMLPMLWW